MTTEHDNDQTPADRPTTGEAPEATGTKAPATTDAAPDAPTDASLATVQAMHERLVKLAARQDAADQRIAEIVARVNAAHDHVLAVGAELAPAIVNLQGITNEHGDVLEDLIGRVDQLAAGAQSLPRGEVARRLPAAPAAGTTAGAPPPAASVLPGSSPPAPRPPLFPGVTTPLAPGETKEQTFHLDPRNPSSLVHQLDNGGEVEFRIQSPRGGGITRDGRSGRGGTRRG